MKFRLLLLVSVLVVVSLSCSLLNAGERLQEVAEDAEELQREVEEMVEEEMATEESGAAESETAESEEEPASEDEAPFVAADALEGLESYRSMMSIKVESGDENVEQMVIEFEITRDPAAQRITMEGAGEEDSMEIIQIGDQQWMRFGDSWMQSQSEDIGDMSEGLFFTPEDLNETVQDEEYKFIGREEVNGIKTRHYQLKDLVLDTLFGSAYLEEVEDVNADIWIADESNLPNFTVRFLMKVKGEVDGEGSEGTLTMQMDVTDVNADITIEPPEDAKSGGLPEDVPLHPDAQELTSMSGMTMFTVDSTVDDMAAYYAEQLAGAGWSEGEEGFSSEDAVMQNWVKGERTLQLTISAEDDGTVSVMLMLQQPEE